MSRKKPSERGRSLLWASVCALSLALCTLYVLLDAFVIVRRYAVVAEATAAPTQAETAATTVPAQSEAAATTVPAQTETAATTAPAQLETAATTAPAQSQAAATSAPAQAENAATTAPAQSETAATSAPVVTDNSYEDERLRVVVTTYRENGTDVHVAEVWVQDASVLQTALAENTYGRNVTERVSDMAADTGAVLAVNGDYYGARNSGYVIRNGVLYRDKRADADQEDLVVYADGTFAIIREGDVGAQALLDAGAWQAFSFGPALIDGGEIVVTSADEVGRSMTSNPRTALAMIEPLHYLFVVADGRTSESAGLSLSELASFLKGLGATVAYNLDGGGSSTMVFLGEVINYPTTNGRYSEREVSDIVSVR